MAEALSQAQQQFILHWGEMSSRWGINRSMAQVHALLYLSEEPLCAEQIAEQLSLARSNVSTSLRELQAWGVVRVIHRLGVRKDYFQAEADAWEMFLTILHERKKREIDPTLEMLRACLDQHEQTSAADVSFVTQRMSNLLELLEMLVSWYEQARKLPPPLQRKMLRLGPKLGELIDEVHLFRKRQEPPEEQRPLAAGDRHGSSGGDRGE